MSEQTQAAASQPAPTTLTVAQAAQRYAESKNPEVSEAARKLGQQSAQARQARQAEASASQHPQKEEVQNVVDEPADGEPQDETVSAEPSTDETQTQVEPESQTIDLGDGVSVTVDEVRNGLMLKADHTRKTMALAEARKGMDAAFSQRTAQLDEMLGVLQSEIGPPKSLSDWIKEFGTDAGVEKFAEQQDKFQRVHRARTARDQVEQQRHSEALDLRDKELAESYNKEWSDPDKRDKDYTAFTQFALKLGADPQEIRMMTKPWMVQVLDKAFKFDQLKDQTATVTKIVSGKPQVVRPGAKVSAQASKHSTLQQAQSRLKQSGSLADAVAVLRARRGG